ncbi:Protein kinase-like domain protein [Drechmeria coniospora]|uniref:Protein kinase-like domain protein n=1 Tax=Drechmeria coniospora TaxID=98403 RepID=A0A151GV22_DRECN|nr:Protein kinase-like domain protein [Drechmeria coniospora]KYK60911.1 Protein kinase-like domain protein [Drechmeria coniospora]
MEGHVVSKDPVSPKWTIPPYNAPPVDEFCRPPGPLKLRPPRARSNSESNHAEKVSFRFRTRLITAAATKHSYIHPHVLLLQVLPSTTERLVRTVVGLLPSFLRAQFEAFFPEWSISSRLVLKRYKEGWDEEFDMEKVIYERVKPLQGIVVPICYGELKYKGTRSLLLSDIGGENLATPEGSLAEPRDLRRMLHEAFSALSQFGIAHGDLKLDNFHIVGDKIFVLDLESVDENLSDEDFAIRIKDDIKFLTRQYEANQDCFWEDGLVVLNT